MVNINKYIYKIFCKNVVGYLREKERKREKDTQSHHVHFT